MLVFFLEALSPMVAELVALRLGVPVCLEAVSPMVVELVALHLGVPVCLESVSPMVAELVALRLGVQVGTVRSLHLWNALTLCFAISVDMMLLV